MTESFVITDLTLLKCFQVIIAAHNEDKNEGSGDPGDNNEGQDKDDEQGNDNNGNEESGNNAKDNNYDQ